MKPESQYNTQMLIDNTELDVVGRMKDLGSRNGYFAALGKFTETAPQLFDEVVRSQTAEEWSDSERKLQLLQSMLQAIGATTLLKNIERIVEGAKSGNLRKRVREAHSLKYDIDALCAEIEAAKGDDSGTAIHLAEDEPAAAGATGKTKSSVREKIRATPDVGEFERLSDLIESFEMDDAMAALLSLAKYSYGDSVDASLALVKKHLLKYDYSSASAEIKRLLFYVKNPESGKPGGRTVKILAIDDVPDVLNSVKAILGKRYTVYAVTNHAAALKFLTSNTADLILLDIEMPGMDGFALLQVIRKLEAYEKTPVVILTGNVSMANIQRAIAEGANDFLKKPVDEATLLAKAEQHLATSEANIEHMVSDLEDFLAKLGTR